jgi:hypothetical protein
MPFDAEAYAKRIMSEADLVFSTEFTFENAMEASATLRTDPDLDQVQGVAVSATAWLSAALEGITGKTVGGTTTIFGNGTVEITLTPRSDKDTA